MKKNQLVVSLLAAVLAFSVTNVASASLDAVAAAVSESEAYEAAQRRARAKAKAAAEAEKKAERERAYNEYLTDKKRDQSYEDQLRLLELEERKLELERKKARVQREGDFIDQELKREAAQTDVIQSEADANRHLSKGAEVLMNKEGDARVKKESGFFK